MRPTLAVIIPVGDDIGSLPGFGGGWGSGNRPDNSLPGYGHPGGGPIYHPGHPDHGLPSGPPDHAWWGGGRPDRPGNDLPWAPVHPGNRPPGSGGGHPGNRPPGSWGGRPDQGLPGEQPGIDNSLPGGWGRPDQGLPGPQPKAYSAAIPPKPPESVNTEEGVWVIVDVNGTLAWAWAQKPESQPGIDNSLPGGKPPTPGQELPEHPEPK